MDPGMLGLAMTTSCTRRGLADALATSPLRWLALSWTTSSAAGWGFMVVLSVFAYRSGGATAVGLAAVVRMVPAGLAAPFAGLWGDRLSRRDVLLATSAARAVAVAAIALVVATGGGLPPVLAPAALVPRTWPAQKPAEAALLPLLAAPPRQLGAANALSSATSNPGSVAGSLRGGLAIA